ncbi:uncharacterized protein LOC132316551 [Cornus florida]|uniref:uncharacterized protein LOC132316551 n=1 Tax=Cornus florida TaxID=4283 RepID=UPI00289CF14B|nr:uncharacterized protein LOC132316551 [Cornus florida]
MENVKTGMAGEFVADSKRDIHEFLDKILEVVSDARNCCLDGSTDAIDDGEFTRMMFVDGCFLLYIIDKFVQFNFNLKELSGHLGYGRWAMLIGDLILLENQLPFLVLQTLMSARFPKDEGEGLIETFIDTYFVNAWILGQRSNGAKYDGDQQPLHLLELTRRRFLGSHSPMTGHGQISSTRGEDGPRKQDEPGCCSFKRPSLSRLKRHRATKQEDLLKDMFGSESFRSATELKARGIQFRASNTCILNDITFTSRFLHGLVTLPHVVVTHQTTKRVFSNMIGR